VKPGWICVLWLLLFPSYSRAEPSLQSTCQKAPCALLTAGTEQAPTENVQRLAAQLQEAGGWTSLRTGYVVEPDERDLAPFRQMLLTARAIYGDQERDLSSRAEEVRRMLQAEFFSALPSIAPWQAVELQSVLAQLCDQLIAVTPRTDQPTIARTCLVHLPELRLQITEGKGASAFEAIYQRALDERARGYLELVTDPGCEIAVAGLRAPASYVHVSDPLPGVYNVVVYCKQRAILFPLDAYDALSKGKTQIFLAGNVRTQLRAHPSGTAHLAFPKWRLEDVYRAARNLLAENHLTAVIVVHAEPDLVTEMVRAESVVRLPTASLIATSTPRTAAGLAASDAAGIPTERKRHRIAAITLGTTAVVGALAAWSLATWSSRGPVQDFIDSADDKTLTQERYDSLETRWRRSRVALHVVGATSVAIGDLALIVARERLAQWPRWVHWTIGGVGLGLATYGIVEIVRTSACDNADPRYCANKTYQRDRGGLALYTAIPFLSEPLITTAWMPHLSVDRSRTHATLNLSWAL